MLRDYRLYLDDIATSCAKILLLEQRQRISASEDQDTDKP